MLCVCYNFLMKSRWLFTIQLTPTPRPPKIKIPFVLLVPGDLVDLKLAHLHGKIYYIILDELLHMPNYTVVS